MTNHCSTIVPPSNFPSEFSYGKTTLNNNIMFNSRVSSQKSDATDTALCSPSFKS